MDTPNSKSFMASIPKMVGDHLSAYGGDGDSSRQAYEKLFDFVGGNDEGSQLSRIQKMMESEDESEAANAIVSHLAKSPGPGGTGLSSYLCDPHSNITGLSFLNEMSKQPSSSKDESGLSIMARVLGGSSSSAIVSESMPSPSKKSATSSVSGSKVIKSPTKSKAGSFFRHATVAPQTPQKSPSSSGFFSTNGTPLGLYLTAPFSPARSALLKSESLGTNLTVPYSPAPSILFRSFDEKTGDENRFAFDQDSRVCEDSNQLGDLAVGADLSNANQTNGNSLIIAPEEFDAISGLGALSNSPFKTVKSLARRDWRDGDASDKKNKKSKSFFARVIGDSKEKSPQKKLHF